MSASRNTIVLDSNLIVSAFLNPKGAASEALQIGLEHFELAASSDTIAELLEVLKRDKFDKYLSKAERRDLAELYVQNTVLFNNLIPVNECKDPKDNKFLSLALTAKARLIVSGDKRDLISMNSFQGIEIIGIRGFIDNHNKYISTSLNYS
jgi:putative PIN family toxin of toxin-antitoxin system